MGALATRGLDGLNHGHLEVKDRFSVPFLPLSLSLLFSFSLSISLSDVLLAPATAPARSLLLYPKSESPSMEWCNLKFGIDFTGLGERDACVEHVGDGRE